MPSPVLQPALERLSAAVLLNPPRKRWTRGELQAIEASGILNEQYLELVDGELINKMGKNRPHIIVATLVHAWLLGVFGAEFVNQEAPIDVRPEDNPTNEPTPDLIVLRRSSIDLISSNPTPSDLQLVIEISDSSVGFDLLRKAALYARADILEYLVFDVTERRVIVHRNPQAGKYQFVAAYAADENIAPLAAPEAFLRVQDAFPPVR